ncbi:uncharacterized protein BDZ99DRAFT_481410 [Mytilinidion resinicola]|uniref:Uncharacterized protein n=1 Tax=Mytilinidion resinicola TaxID=574789 RepID=A0A6A6Y7U7_9PEZI|nr:uncharacterized protein BDZ99DRAFT_481410 [Mytilinidion resinicola]KAF2804255.1 hypothetical protein BDZ99DRAFT_481410 [Mytilinidion resinicola]
MAAPTLTALPAEIRQQIAKGTVALDVTSRGYKPSSPLAGVCRLLREDVAEILPSWLPTPDTDVVISMEEALRHLQAAETHYASLAAASSRQSHAIEHIRIKFFNAQIKNQKNDPRYDSMYKVPLPVVLQQIRADSEFQTLMDGPKFRGGYGWLEANNQSDPNPNPFRSSLRNLNDLVSALNDSVRLPNIKRVTLDLNMPPTALKFLEECGPGGKRAPRGATGREAFKYQAKYWDPILREMSRIRITAREKEGLKPGQKYFDRSRGGDDILKGLPFLPVEIVGKLPSSQEDALRDWPDSHSDWTFEDGSCVMHHFLQVLSAERIAKREEEERKREAEKRKRGEAQEEGLIKNVVQKEEENADEAERPSKKARLILYGVRQRRY